mmetsp:Transcript_9674/g.16268  ORF Transcript_9674/g.16268 Transcript_9674/m.16268 type:complete len:264 (+) Transcript_9674:32-823(+)
MSGLAQCICCSICLIIVIVVAFIILSFSSLPVNTYGLDYSPITKQISEQGYDSGFHYIGFMHKFIEYPTTMQTLSFSDASGANRGPIEARSKDGLMVNFRAQFQYQFNQKDLHQLYMRYGEDYKSPCIRFAVDVMNDEASQFSASMFFRDLTTVGIQMQTQLEKVFLNECFSRVQSLQLSQADLPERFEEALTATNVAIQESITVQQTQQNVVIDMQTQVNQAKISAPVVVNNAEAKVNSTLVNNLAQMESYYKITQTEATAY